MKHGIGLHMWYDDDKRYFRCKPAGTVACEGAITDWNAGGTLDELICFPLSSVVILRVGLI